MLSNRNKGFLNFKFLNFNFSYLTIPRANWLCGKIHFYTCSQTHILFFATKTFSIFVLSSKWTRLGRISSLSDNRKSGAYPGFSIPVESWLGVGLVLTVAVASRGPTTHGYVWKETAGKQEATGNWKVAAAGDGRKVLVFSTYAVSIAVDADSSVYLPEKIKENSYRYGTNKICIYINCNLQQWEPLIWIRIIIRI